MNGHKAFIDTSAILRFLIKDDEAKGKAVGKLIKESKQNGITLYIPPVVILEIVWVLEKVYKYPKKSVREVVEAVLNTPELKCSMEETFKKAVSAYEINNIKFADAVMGFWGLSEGIRIVYTYDEKDFKKIDELTVKRP